METEDFIENMLKRSVKSFIPTAVDENIFYVNSEGNGVYRLSLPEETDKIVATTVKEEVYSLSNIHGTVIMITGGYSTNGGTRFVGEAISRLSSRYSKFHGYRVGATEFVTPMGISDNITLDKTLAKLEYIHPFIHITSQELITKYNTFGNTSLKELSDIGGHHRGVFNYHVFFSKKDNDYQLIHLNHRYLFSIAYDTDITAIFKNKEDYQKFICIYPDVIEIAVTFLTYRRYVVEYMDSKGTVRQRYYVNKEYSPDTSLCLF
jgi:hypothetical protein